MANKPKPPPLDDESASAASGELPAAESGKATAEDAALAAAKERARLAEDAALAASASAPPPVSPPTPSPASDEPGAIIVDSSGVMYARPDPTKPLSLTASVVLGNWFGSFNGKPAHVRHGTPIAALPSALVQAIRSTRKQSVGVLPPKAPSNPFTP